jgi:hypothetical protein
VAPAVRRPLLVLAHLRLGHTYAQLAAGFEVGVSTVYRYITEAVGLLAVRAPDLATAVAAACAGRRRRGKGMTGIPGSLESIPVRSAAIASHRCASPVSAVTQPQSGSRRPCEGAGGRGQFPSLSWARW